MSSITTSESYLRKRQQTLQRLFGPIAPSNRVQVFFRPFGEQLALGLGANDFGANLRLARHRTRRPNVYVNYYEWWTPTKFTADDGRTYVLEHAYMHLDEPDRNGDDKEVLALHCDPQTPKANSLYKYKRGPHFHITSERPNFSKAHIATCITNLDSTCASLDALTAAMKEMILMINDELLERL